MERLINTFTILLILLLNVVRGQQPICNGNVPLNCTEMCRETQIKGSANNYYIRNAIETSSVKVSKVTCNNSMPHYGAYKYSCDRIKYPPNPGFICGANDNEDSPFAYLCYPTNENISNLPILSFTHGLGAGGTGEESDYKGLFETFASWGIVVVAPESCINHSCWNLFYDQETAIMQPQSNISLHEIFTKVNFSKIAIGGHSMGGITSMMTAGQWMNNYMYTNFTAKCALLLHPGYVCVNCLCNDMMNIPSMWTTGTQDDIVKDKYVIECFDKETNPKTKPKVIADLVGATHFEPNSNDGGHLAPYMAQFMLCQLNQDETACQYIYGNNQDSLCNACDYANCTIVK